MAWTATIVSTELVNGSAVVNIKATNGTDNASARIETRSLAYLKQRVNEFLQQCTDSEALKTLLTPGVFDSTIVVTPPTQAELDSVAWFKDWTNLKGAQQLIAAGVISNTLPAYQTLLARVIANFKNIYVTLL